MTIAELNNLSEQRFFEEMQKCCGSTAWVNEMLAKRPFESLEELLNIAEKAWQNTYEKDWLEAFDHHPKIGDIKSLEKKFSSTKTLAGGEQASVQTASPKTLEALAKGNTDYENKFGFIFIVCATGKTAEEMLSILQARYPNDRNTELTIAADEQEKITLLRLKKLMT
ncbi:MAG: 2-oxo-4-hydroxy-4-carboxy-5-ureidoimidazoline decarboxylase [Bacteroidetes bacterium]|nr:MAG: 2-oxo-4-hydroxy-4-carboxy-5-ureidoimidazoline decarboxylase [Bacteroidota bacterium]